MVGIIKINEKGDNNVESIDQFLSVFQDEDFRTFIYSGDFNLITILCILMVIDIITGLAKAVKNKNLWSRKSLFGFARKVLVFLIITVANLLDLLMNLNGTLVLATVTFYILNEVLSITENSAQIGIPLPDRLMEVIEVVNKKSETQKEVDKIMYKEVDSNGEKENS